MSKRSFSEQLFCRYWDSWYPEIGAVTLSLSCMVALAAVLSAYDGRRMPEFGWGLTFNAIISTLATISKVALFYAIPNAIGQLKWVWFRSYPARRLIDAEIFDSASRGPMGAFQMLTTRTRYSIGSIGAILTIVALAFDPFVQLIVDYATDVQYRPSNDTVAWQANTFASDWLYVRQGFLNNTLQAQVYASAMWSFGMDWTPQCWTGTCTWPEFSTLEWYTDCGRQRIWTMEGDCSVGVDEKWFEAVDEVQARDPYAVSVSFNRTCVVRSDDGYSVDADITFEIFFRVRGYAEESPSWYVQTSYPQFKAGVISAPFYNLDTQRVRAEFPAPGDSPRISNLAMVDLAFLNWTVEEDLSLSVSSTDCTLDLCLLKSNLSIENGVFFKKLISSQSIVKSLNTFEIKLTQEEQDVVYSSTRYVCFQPKEGGTLDIATMYDRQHLQQDKWKVRTSADVYKYLYTPKENNFIFCQEINVLDIATLPGLVQSSLQSFTQGVRNGYLDVSREQVARGQLNFTEWTDWAHHFTHNDLEGERISLELPLVQQLGVGNFMGQLCEVLTKIMVDPAMNNGTTPVQGQMGEVVTVVHVRWPWMILPVTLAVFGAIFLALTIVVSSQAQAPLWKSSVSALLYHGPDLQLAPSKPLNTISEMERQAAKSTARLLATSDQQMLLQPVLARRGPIIE